MCCLLCSYCIKGSVSVFLSKKKIFILYIVFSQLGTSGLIANSESSASLSFCIADLKFSNNGLKVCELGQGVYSAFRGYDALYGQGALWAHVWNFLANFNKPMWFISPRLSDNNIKDVAVDVLEKSGGKAYSSLLALKRDVLFKRLASERNNNQNRTSIADYSAIIFVRKEMRSLRDFIKRYPNVLVVDQKSACFVGNKYLTHSLFQNDEYLMNYRPKCCVCPKRLSTRKIKQILHELASDYCVIKPINASMGRGIVIVERENLLKAVKGVFQQDTEIESEDESSYAYWKKDKNEIFLIEEYVPSKQVCVDDKWYDPTMRVAFIVVVDNGKMQINFLDAYWKLPGKALDANGSFTELHKSHVAKQGKGSCAVTPDDFKLVTTQLEGVLLKLFCKMHTIDTVDELSGSMNFY